MTRVPPSQQLREAIATLLADGQAGEADIASTLIRLGAQRVVQELLEQEVTDHLERGHYERADATEPHRGYRNGYKQRQRAGSHRDKRRVGGLDLDQPGQGDVDAMLASTY